MAEPVSALHGRLEPGDHGDAPGLRLSERRGLKLWQIVHWPDRRDACARALQSELPAPGTAVETEGRVLLAVGPDSYWLVADGDESTQGPDARLDADTGTASELDHARVVLRLQGPAVRRVLAKGLPIDLHPREFPVGGVAMSAVHGIALLLHRAGDEIFDLYVPRSYAADFWEWLTDAAAEFGYGVEAGR